MNMERFLGAEEPEIKKPPIWKKFKKLGEAVALTALLSLPGLELAFAQEKGEEKDTRVKIEQSIKEAAVHVQKIAAILKEKGGAGYLKGLSPEKIPIRSLILPESKQMVEVGYKGQVLEDNSRIEKEPLFFIQEKEEGAIWFYDKNADGSLDRVILNNNTPRPGTPSKSFYNREKTLSSMDDLAFMADLKANSSLRKTYLPPEKIVVFEISFENDNYVVQSVDFEKGKFDELNGSEAEKAVSQLQEIYTKSVESLENKITK